jgi:hypothetical protein
MRGEVAQDLRRLRQGTSPSDLAHRAGPGCDGRAGAIHLRRTNGSAPHELGTIVWTGPRADADMDLLASAYLGASH